MVPPSYAPVTPREARKPAQMDMSVSGYRKWEQGTRRVSGRAAALLRVIQRELEAVKRALFTPGQV